MAGIEFYVNHYGEELDKDKFVGLESLIKKNGGKFKSEKQKKFILWKWQMDEYMTTSEYSWFTKHFGDQKEGYKWIEVEGYYSFSHGKGKGHVPAQFVYKLDENGIVAKFKGHFNCNNGGSSLNYMELVWETENEHKPFKEVKEEEVKEEAKPEEPVSQYVGEVGEWLDVEVTCEFSTEFETQWGWTYLNSMFDKDGNNYVWYTQSWKIDKGKTLKIHGKVKGHKEFNGTKQTILKLVKEVK